MKMLIGKIYAFSIIIVISAYSAVFGQTIRISGKLYEKEEMKTVSNGVIFLNPGKISTITDNIENIFLLAHRAGNKYPRRYLDISLLLSISMQILTQ